MNTDSRTLPTQSFNAIRRPGFYSGGRKLQETIDRTHRVARGNGNARDDGVEGGLVHGLGPLVERAVRDPAEIDLGGVGALGEKVVIVPVDIVREGWGVERLIPDDVRQEVADPCTAETPKTSPVRSSSVSIGAA
jgi:hypothetical protein